MLTLATLALQFVVESLEEYLPARRQELTPSKRLAKAKLGHLFCSRSYSHQQGRVPGVLRSLGTTTGFKPEEIFRKYLWYLLRERKFDHSAVDDVVYLKNAMGLSDEQVRGGRDDGGLGRNFSAACC